MKDSYFVYILASKPKGVLYTGFTSDLASRIDAHKKGLVEGFTKKYHVHRLVYFEILEDREEALRREKLIKKWKRNWKIELIEKNNPNWQDLYPGLLQ
jgi:putative endonuclease